MERWICACELWDSELGDLFLNYLQAGASLRGNFEFLLPKMWETRTTPVSVQNCYKIVRKLFSYRAVYFYDRLRTFFRQPSQAYLETSSSWGNFLTSAPGTPSYKGDRVFLWVLHSLEICLYAIQAFSMLWSPIWG